MDSEDSDFYGDKKTVQELVHRVEDFDAARWWKEHPQGPSGLRRTKEESTVGHSSPHLHNPYAGIPYAWQLTETVDDFLARLPPATTERTEATPWIYICNPYIPRKAKVDAQNQKSRGNEDEAPEEEGSNLEMFLEGGEERLAILKDALDNIPKSRKSKAAINREIKQHKDSAISDVLNLANGCHIKSGKWMIFSDPQDVDDVWEVVARATANNELGIAAKVLPRQENDTKKERPVIVYTADFIDKKDVERVLQKLRELKLVETRGRNIYYKPDAYTYLGIAYGNTWDIKASIYNSSDFFMKKVGEGESAAGWTF